MKSLEPLKLRLAPPSDMLDVVSVADPVASTKNVPLLDNS